MRKKYFTLLLFILSNFMSFSQITVLLLSQYIPGHVKHLMSVAKNDGRPYKKALQISNRQMLINLPLSSNDTVPKITATTNGAKVVMADAGNSLEFSPYSLQNNGVLIQPINRTENKGISASFFLHDTSFWKFYTNSFQRLTIGGNGNIITHTPLLVNDALPDSNLALRVNGNARFDSSVTIMSSGDSTSFLSFNRGFGNAWGIRGDGITPYTSTPTLWAQKYGNLPIFRLRHPNNVSSFQGENISAQRDFMILPYEYGIAIDYNGVVECWVGEWSIHKGMFYKDIEGKGNGWGAVFWIGDDVDGGGVRGTARNNTSIGGNVAYGELSVENFSGLSNGDFRLRLPSTEDEFQFVYGERGSTNIVASLSDKGLILPNVSTITNIQTAKKGQIVFDSTLNEFKGFNGTDWIGLINDSKIGKITMSSDGTNTTFIIAHGLNKMPAFFNILPTSQDASKFNYVTADNANIYIHYNIAPAAGDNNLSWNWEVKK